TQQSSGTWLVVILNTTTGDSFRKTITYKSSLSSAEWVEEAPSAGRQSTVPLDTFGAVSFASATTVENGQQRTIAQAGGLPVTMYNPAAQALAQPSVLGSDGASFTVTRTDAPASRPASRRRYIP
ncbi:MAG TPA: G1 family glutamic endopeptidase, partial [Anaerolineae bacterium]